MNEYAKKSILEMARGGFLEVTDLEMTKAIANIMDPNTSATAKRKITVTIELKADDSRQNIGVSYTVKSALAPTNAVTTMLYNSFRDKIVQHCLCEQVLEPLLSKTFIYDNYASQKGNGTHFGLDRLKAFMAAYYRKNGAGGWVLKCDVRKYFYRINHDVLKTQLRRLIKDRDVLWLLDMIIDSTEGPGIPIGNHTSQWFAILYLSDMDHMIKERLGIKYYGRYMDDFYLIHEDRAYLQFCLEEIRRFLVPLGLELNRKTAIFPLSQGIDFLGFRTYLTDSGKVVRKVRRESKNRIRRKIKKFRHLVDEGRVDFDTVLQSYNSWTGHADHGNSYHLISEIDDLFFNLFREEMEGKPYGEISIRFARWKRRQVGEHKVQRTGDPVDRRHTGHVPWPNGPGDGTHDHAEMLRREGAEQQQQ